jgi:hypothetical protein
MMGYIVLAVFIVFVLGCFFSFLGGLRTGRKQAEAEYAEEQRQKEQDKKDFDKAEAEIKQEVFGNAKDEKKKLSGNSGRDKFNAINSGLQNNSPR